MKKIKLGNVIGSDRRRQPVSMCRGSDIQVETCIIGRSQPCEQRAIRRLRGRGGIGSSKSL